jgi:hypothetical protein
MQAQIQAQMQEVLAAHALEMQRMEEAQAEQAREMEAMRGKTQKAQAEQARVMEAMRGKTQEIQAIQAKYEQKIRAMRAAENYTISELVRENTAFKEAEKPHAKRQKARDAILAIKIKLSKNPSAPWPKHKVINFFKSYHPQIRNRTDCDWFIKKIEALPKYTFPGHEKAPKDHVSFLFTLCKENCPDITIHPCTRKITEEID